MYLHTLVRYGYRFVAPFRFVFTAVERRIYEYLFLFFYFFLLIKSLHQQRLILEFLFLFRNILHNKRTFAACRALASSH